MIPYPPESRTPGEKPPGEGKGGPGEGSGGGLSTTGALGTSACPSCGLLFIRNDENDIFGFQMCSEAGLHVILPSLKQEGKSLYFPTK